MNHGVDHAVNNACVVMVVHARQWPRPVPHTRASVPNNGSANTVKPAVVVIARRSHQAPMINAWESAPVHVTHRRGSLNLPRENARVSVSPRQRAVGMAHVPTTVHARATTIIGVTRPMTRKLSARDVALMETVA